MARRGSFGTRKVESRNVRPVYADGYVAMRNVVVGAEGSGSNLGRGGWTSSLIPVSVIGEWTLPVGLSAGDPDHSS